MATSPWTLPAPSGSETLRAPARSSSSDCSLTTAAPVPARSSPAPSVAQTTAGRTSTSLAAIARIVAASTPASSATRSGRNAASSASSSRSCGSASPASRRPASSPASRTPMMPLSTSGISARLGDDAHGGGVAEVAVAGVEHHQVGAVAHGPAKRGAGHRVVVHGAVADHEDGARLLEHAQGAGGVAHAGAHARARERDAARPRRRGGRCRWCRARRGRTSAPGRPLRWCRRAR